MSSSELKEEIDLELAQLRQLLEQFACLTNRPDTCAPDKVEVLAAAGLLHSFYTGIENIFKRIAIHADGHAPRGEAWHSQLLNSMAQGGAGRSRVISASLRDCLRKYLNFRHFFRQAYSFQMEWSKMAPLVLDCTRTLDQLEAELRDFMRTPGDHS